MNKTLLTDMNLQELETVVCELGEQKFRAKQLYKWLVKGVDFAQMSNVEFSHKIFIYFSSVAINRAYFVNAHSGNIAFYQFRERSRRTFRKQFGFYQIA